MAKSKMTACPKRLESIKYLYNKEKYSKAYSELIEYMEEYPKDDFAKFLYARIEEKIGNRDVAKYKFKEVADGKSPVRYSAMVEYGKMLLNEDSDEALKILKKAIKESNHEEAYAIRLLINNLINSGEYEDAFYYIYKMSNEDEQNALIARLNGLRGQNYNAKTYLDKVNIKNVSDDTLLHIAETENICERYDKALDAVEYLSNKKNSYYERAELQKAIIYCSTGDYDNALYICERVKDTGNPDYAKGAYLTIGIVYDRMADYESAKENYQKATETNENSIQTKAILALTNLEYEIGNIEEAKLKYEELINNKFKKKSEPYSKLISIYLKENNYKKVEEIYKLMMDNTDDFTIMESRIIKALIDKYNNNPIKIDERSSYTEKQIDNYSREEAIKHVKEHREHSAPFTINYSIDELYDKTLPLLTKENMTYGDLFDIYEIDCIGIGSSIDRYRVITIPNTKNIITMYPHNDKKYNKPSDYEQVKKQREAKKQERLNNIYKRFNYNQINK